MDKIKERLRKICTYHGDDGTSGYCLSEQQFSQVLKLIEEGKEQGRREAWEQGRREERERVINQLGNDWMEWLKYHPHYRLNEHLRLFFKDFIEALND